MDSLQSNRDRRKISVIDFDQIIYDVLFIYLFNEIYIWTIRFQSRNFKTLTVTAWLTFSFV
jgi:hypothetical protein